MAAADEINVDATIVAVFIYHFDGWHCLTYSTAASHGVDLAVWLARLNVIDRWFAQSHYRIASLLQILSMRSL